MLCCILCAYFTGLSIVQLVYLAALVGVNVVLFTRSKTQRSRCVFYELAMIEVFWDKVGLRPGGGSAQDFKHMRVELGLGFGARETPSRKWPS